MNRATTRVKGKYGRGSGNYGKQNTNIDIMYKTGILILMAAFLTFCTFRGKRIEGVRMTDSYERCEEFAYDFGDIITFGDSNNRFMVGLPYEWAIQDSYSDTLYGIAASNIWEAEENPALFMSFSVTGYSTTDSLRQYFAGELKTLKSDHRIKILEAGETLIKENKSYWVKFVDSENENHYRNLVMFVRSPIRNEIYLIHSMVADGEEADRLLCAMKRLAFSFEIVNP